MPFKLRVFLDLRGAGEPHPEHLRAFGASVFERGLYSDHHAYSKSHSVGRMVQGEHGTWALDSGALDDRLLSVARSRLTPGAPVFLGSLKGEVRDSKIVASATWGELENVSPLETARFISQTPMHFRSKRRTILEPDSNLLFGSVLRRCSDLPSLEGLDLRSIRFGTELDGASETTTGPGRYDHTLARRVAGRVAAWEGTVTVNVQEASSDQRRSLTTLALLAEFSGVGADTTAGFGAVRVDVSDALPAEASP